MAGVKKPTLVLHFDINKTIIICDPVKGVGCDAMLNSLLSEVSWGTWDKDVPYKDVSGKLQAAGTWKLKVGPTTEKQESLITYAELLEEVLQMDKQEMLKLKTSFTEVGHPGESIRSTYLDLQSKLKLPDGISLSDIPSAVGEGRHFVLPSFFKLILKLEEEHRDFRIVFRTFGTDLADVVNEFNLFCNGEHPCFPEVPTAIKRRKISLPSDSGEFYRDDVGLHLSMCAKVKSLELVQLMHGYDECAKALRAKLLSDSPTLSLALRDCFPFWRNCKESDDSGKVLLIEPSGKGAHHMFFDDNIERHRAHIVDARNAVTGERMPFSETQGLYLIRAEPFLAIKDPDYFIKQVARVEEELARRYTEHSVSGGYT